MCAVRGSLTAVWESLLYETGIVTFYNVRNTLILKAVSCLFKSHI
jgi:hypothetical protein